MNLNEFFTKHPRAAIAFSGGVDSVYLLYAAIRSGADVTAYYVKTAFQPQFELADAKKMAAHLHANLVVIPVCILQHKEIEENPANRCYYCKRELMSAIAEAAQRDGYDLVLDGTNASDVQEDRPGMRALREQGVRSPLRECGLEKETIRRLSREAGLFTWDKPAYACLATRIAVHEVITEDKLQATEAAEAYLQELGFSDVRVRMQGELARVQVREADLARVLQYREAIAAELKKYYKWVTLDLEVRA